MSRPAACEGEVGERIPWQQSSGRPLDAVSRPVAREKASPSGTSPHWQRICGRPVDAVSRPVASEEGDEEGNPWQLICGRPLDAVSRPVARGESWACLRRRFLLFAARRFPRGRPSSGLLGAVLPEMFAVSVFTQSVEILILVHLENMEGTDLPLIEFLLAGEPQDVISAVAPFAPSTLFPSNLLYAATEVVIWPGAALVAKTGLGTEPGKIAEAFSDRAWCHQTSAGRSSQALFVLCFAATLLIPGDINKLTACNISDERFHRLLVEPTVLRGFAGLMVPPRVPAKSTIAGGKREGTHASLITGVHNFAAVASAKELGTIPHRRSTDAAAAEYSELQGIEDQDDAEGDTTKRATGWSRAQPLGQATTAKSWLRQGYTVAVIGYGYNVARTLRSADIGVTVGFAGPDVANGEVDRVLLGDRFATIVVAEAVGRRVFFNSQQAATYLLCVFAFGGSVITITLMLGWTIPSEGAQLFLAIFITHASYPRASSSESAGFFGMMQPPCSRSRLLIFRMARHVPAGFSLVSHSAPMRFPQYAGSYMCSGEGEMELMLLWCNMYQYGWGFGYVHVVASGVFNMSIPDVALQNGSLGPWSGCWGSAFHADNGFLRFAGTQWYSAVWRSRIHLVGPEWSQWEMQRKRQG